MSRRRLRPQPVEEPEGAEGGGEAEEPTNVPEAEPEVPLSYADLADATLELPTQCVDWLFGDGASTTHTLVGGEVTGLPSESFLFELMCSVKLKPAKLQSFFLPLSIA